MKKIMAVFVCFALLFNGSSVFASSLDNSGTTNPEKGRSLEQILEERCSKKEILFEVDDKLIDSLSEKTVYQNDSFVKSNFNSKNAFMASSKSLDMADIFDHIPKNLFTTPSNDQDLFVSNTFAYGEDYRNNSRYALFYSREYIKDEDNSDINHVATDFIVVRITNTYSEKDDFDKYNRGYLMTNDFKVQQVGRYVYNLNTMEMDPRYSTEYESSRIMKVYDIGTSFVDLTNSKSFLWRVETSCIGKTDGSSKGVLFAGLAFCSRTSPYLYAIEELMSRSLEKEYGDIKNYNETFDNNYDAQNAHNKGNGAIKTAMFGFRDVKLNKINHKTDAYAIFKINKKESLTPNFHMKYSFKIGLGYNDEYQPK